MIDDIPDGAVEGKAYLWREDGEWHVAIVAPGWITEDLATDGHIRAARLEIRRYVVPMDGKTQPALIYRMVETE